MFSSIVSAVLSFIEGSVLNLHTWVGVFLGAVFSSLWLAIWNWLKAWIVKEVPKSATIVKEVQDVADAVIADIKPVADAVTSATTSDTTSK